LAEKRLHACLQWNPVGRHQDDATAPKDLARVIVNIAVQRALLYLAHAH